jgi:hypothetical protein
LTRPSQFGSILVALARSREIRTLGNMRCELSLWPLTFLNYTKMTKYEALEKNAVSEPEMPQLGDLHYSRNTRKPHFIGRFSAYSLMEKLGGRNEWRRERNWDRTFSRYSIVGPRSWADWVRSHARPQPSPRVQGCETDILPRGGP